MWPPSHIRHCHITVTSHFPASQGSLPEIFTVVISLLQITFYRPVVNSPVYASVVVPSVLLCSLAEQAVVETMLYHDDLIASGLGWSLA